MSFEVIPLPRNEIRRKQPVHIEVTNLDAWPNNRFRIRFDWNNTMGRWVIRIKHVDTDTWIVNGVANLMFEYSLDPYVAFILFDPSNTAKSVTEQNLGRNVRLGVFPKEEGNR